MSTHRPKSRPRRPAASRLKSRSSAASGARSADGSDHARTRLEHLYEISKLLSDFEGLERTVSAVLAIATRTLSIRSAILIEASEDHLRMVTWLGEGLPDAMLARARAHAQSTFAYLSGAPSAQALALSEQPGGTGVLPRGPGASRNSKDRSKFIVIPLVVGRRPLFGALQLEGASSLGKNDLVFVNAITNQLAIALDRHHAWQRDIGLRERAEEATRMRDRILEVVSHDLKNPLGAILTTADTLALLKLPQAAQKSYQAAVARIQRAAERMQRLIEDMLDFASIQAGRLAIARRPSEPATMVNEVIAAFEPLAQASQLQLRSEIEPGLAKVYCDSDRIVQVFSNLIGNAIKVTPPGGLILVRAAARPRAVMFTVSDTGPGMAASDLQHLFERHWRSPEASYKGTGLGLSIAKGIVEAHGGRISVESTPGEGASLCFTIPVVVADQARPGTSPTAPEQPPPARGHDDGPSPARAQLDIADIKRVEGAQRFISELTASLSSSLDYSTMLEKVARAVVPQMADWCLVDLFDAEGMLRQTAVAHADPEREEVARTLGRQVDARAARATGVSRVARTGESEMYPEVADMGWAAEALGVEHPELLRELGALSYMCVTLRARGRVLGVISFVRALPVRRYTAGDLAVAEEVGRRAGMAIDNARLYTEAQEAVRVRDEFMSIASHELKTPLTPLQLDLDLLLRIVHETGADQRLVKRLETAHRQTRRLTQLVESLLDVSRLTSGHLSLQLQEFDLVEMAREVIDRHRRDASVAGCELQLHADAPVKGDWDRMRFEQILSNLLSNAIKYGAGQPVQVTVQEADGMARLSVEDQGIGISPQDAERIFARFERAVSPRHYGGLGLGLYVARQLAEAHGGTIVVHSQPGAGAKFTAVLPLQCGITVGTAQPQGEGDRAAEHSHRG
jgi:signal transduction histidine kinase